MSETEITELIGSIGSDYLQRGQHFVKIFSEADLQQPAELTLHEDQPSRGSLTSIAKSIWEDVKSRTAKGQEIKLIFTGNINGISGREQQKWLLEFLSLPQSKLTNFFCNKKLKIFFQLRDLFLSVYQTAGTDLVRCNFEHDVLLHPDSPEANIQSHLIWYDPSHTSKGAGTCSAYKIFYVVAIGTDNAVISSSSSRVIEKRFLSADRVQKAREDFTSLPRLLKQIHFSDNEIKSIVEIIEALIELSQYRAQGDGKKLEFNGLNHLKNAAENLLVKTSQLKAFIINEYLWHDNKRKLKTSDIMNSEIDSFITAIYDVLVRSVWDKYNRLEDTEMHFNDLVTLKLFHSPPLPLFSKEQIYTFGDYLQYHVSVNFEAASSNHIKSKMRSFVTSTNPTDLQDKNSEINSSQNPSTTTCERLCKIIEDFRNARSKSEYLQKLEKLRLKEIKLLTINHQLFVDIYIPEVVSFIRFNWQSFMEGSERFCSKQMKTFLKLSGNVVLQSFLFKETPGKIWTTEDFSSKWFSNDLFDKNLFLIHSLIDEKHQTVASSPWRSQIRYANLHYLQSDQLFFEAIPFHEFVREYRVAFLNWNDNSRTLLEASKHAIYRLELKDAWCCSDYIHLGPDHVAKVQTIARGYLGSVIKIQGYAKVILAKIRLKRLKFHSDQYKEEYLEALSLSRKIFKECTSEMAPILNIDREHKDLKVLSEILPDQNAIETLKRSEKDDAAWLRITISNGRTVLHRETLPGSQACVFYSQEAKPFLENCVDIGRYLPANVRPFINNVFILKVHRDECGDVFVDVKTRTPLYVWNVKTEENKMKRRHLPLSQGALISSSRYRIFSNDHFIHKLAYNTLNKIPYESFNELVYECTTAIIVQKNLNNENCLVESPLWISITNCLPLINLESTSTFNEVERRRKTIDKVECGKYVNNLYIRPRDDWVLENVATELVFSSSKDDPNRVTSDVVDLGRNHSLLDPMIRFEHRHFKIRKFIQNP